MLFGSDLDANRNQDPSASVLVRRLESKKLGPCLIKAWKGEYKSAAEALQDVRDTLEACGRSLATDIDNEIDGFDWANIFTVTKDEQFELRPELQLVGDIK